ncbi:pyrroloquinoline quinone biosynthesis protein PqqF [Pseudomonas sp. H11T01]|uniref:pyrroloquinoline quinone biosynthesis protein PqqF n=1 Tax=Pseudomonas sp. H11T01 TaxID=3402749 RepID=UPI003AD38420
MPALNHPLHHTETLANGLRVSLRHAPRLKRCAAALRVAAGSHDVPLAWPGLAHFLEHLFFLGTERFPADQGLMACVQRHGGQVNARTSERTTDFFFELPSQAFDGGLERLSDMLAHPRLDQNDQLREREVLHAEFIAWSRDASAQQQFSLFDGLSAMHPLRGFHAGNRFSLPVPQPAFQQALGEFYQRFYQTGQMTLSLAGPQSVAELKALAEEFGAALAIGPQVKQSTPPALMATADNSYQQAGERRLNLLFASEQLPVSSPEALDFLCTWINASKPGGLLVELQRRQLVETLKAAPLYQFAGQALLNIEFTLTANGSKQHPLISELFFDWLHFFNENGDWPQLREEYALLQQRKQQVSGAMDLARLDSEQLEPCLSEHGVVTLKALLKQMQPTPADKSASAWQLPPPNPFLRQVAEPARAGLIRGQTSAHRGLRTFAQDRSRGRRDNSSMLFSKELADDTGEGAIYLRWHLNSVAQASLQPTLESSLKPLQEDARQAGVDFSFSAVGNEWLLKMTGIHEPMPAILEQALLRLTKPEADFWQEQGEPTTTPSLVPIRQLLKALPEHCMGYFQHPAPQPVSANDLQHLWSTARWDGLALGLSANTQAAITGALSRMPGIPDNQVSVPLSIRSQHLWSEVPTASSEHALLLFCPTPTQDIADEAAWRLLAQLCQSPFYQRLRVELQLGYAVFSGVRQINGQTGLLFGVQSPSASLREILEHIEIFLQRISELVLGIDDSSLINQCQALATQFDSSALPVPQAAELLWQGRLAGHSSDYLLQLQQAVLLLDRTALLDAARRLIHAEGGRRCLASGACPDGTWQPTARSLPGL